jgi:hypothetical protein
VLVSGVATDGDGGVRAATNGDGGRQGGSGSRHWWRMATSGVALARGNEGRGDVVR